MNPWGLRGTVTAVGVAALVAGFGGAAIYAATGSEAHAMGNHGASGPSGSPHQAFDSTNEDVLHGESVVSGGNGGFTTMLSQTGTITAISATSVSARSADGYTRTYAIPATAASPPFGLGDQVTIRATRVGDVATVTTIRPLLVGH
jgi:ABC-type oligopeptide transport system substrate-binding subunit